jgi:hypothetical protein
VTRYKFLNTESTHNFSNLHSFSSTSDDQDDNSRNKFYREQHTADHDFRVRVSPATAADDD